MAGSAAAKASVDTAATAGFTRPSAIVQVGRFAALWLRELARPRLLIGVALLALALLTLIGLGARAQPGDLAATRQGALDLAGPALGLLALALGARALRGDADAGALDGWLLRPHGALALPLGRALAVGIFAAGFAAALIAGVVLIDTWLGRSLALSRLPLQALGFGLGGLAYAAVGLGCASFGRGYVVLALGWWLAVDTGLSQAAEGLESLALRPAVAFIAGYDPEISLFDLDGEARRLWSAVVRLLVTAALGLAAACLRLRRDAPI